MKRMMDNMKVRPNTFTTIAQFLRMSGVGPGASNAREALMQSQNTAIAVVETKLKDSFRVLEEISTLLKQEKDPLDSIKEIIALIEKSIKKLAEDQLLKLLKVSYSSANLFQSIANVPDPWGILGMNEDHSLYQNRQVNAFLHIAMSKTSTPLQGAVVMPNNKDSDQLNSFKTIADEVKAITELDCANMKVPTLRTENFNIIITQAFVGQNPDITAAYRDAVTAMMDTFATKPESVKAPQILIKQAKDEFYQNMRLSVIKGVLEELNQLILNIGSQLKQLSDSGEAFNIQNIITSESVSYAFDLQVHRYKSAREDAQYQDLLVAFEKMNNLSKYLGLIAVAFDQKVLDGLSDQEQRLALIFGANPEVRPTLQTFGPPSMYPTWLIEAASGGKFFTVERLIQAGASTDALVKPMPGWFDWLYGINHFVKSWINWVISVPTPNLEGETALLYAAKNLLDKANADKAAQKPFLDTVIKIIDLGGQNSGLYTYDKTSTSPYNVLAQYAGLTNPKRGELITSLKSKQKEMQSEAIVMALFDITWQDPFLRSLYNLRLPADSVTKLLNIKDYLSTTIQEIPLNNLLSTIIDDPEVREVVIQALPEQVMQDFFSGSQHIKLITDSSKVLNDNNSQNLPEINSEFFKNIIISKSIDLGINGLNVLYVPDQKNINAFLNDVVILTSINNPFISIQLGITNAAIMLQQGEYKQAATNVATMLGSVLLKVSPILIDYFTSSTLFTSLAKEIILQYTQLSTVANLNAYLDSYNTSMSNFKSNVAYGNIAESTGLKYIAADYFSEALNIAHNNLDNVEMKLMAVGICFTSLEGMMHSHEYCLTSY